MTRTLAIGDIHGHIKPLLALEQLVGFKSTDQLITVGDHVDRGPDSASVLDWAIERHATGQLVPLTGNHELMMLDAIDNSHAIETWLMVGGDQVLQSYQRRGLSGTIDEIPPEHIEFIRSSCLRHYETETHIFVHATLWPDLDLNQQPESALFWDKWEGMQRHKSGKIMVCGHSALRSGWPGKDENSVCIDTRVYGDEGWLTCLDVRTSEFWQANQHGETRYGWLDELDDA